MESISNIPCINCITFAVCNAQMTDDSPFDDIIYKLLPKCSLIRSYAGYTEYPTYANSTELVLKVAKFFKPKAYKDGVLKTYSGL